MKQKMELREVDIVASADFCPKCLPKAYRMLSNLSGFDEAALHNGGQQIVRTAFVVGKQILQVKGNEINTVEKAREIVELGLEKTKEILQPQIQRQEIERIKKEIEERYRMGYVGKDHEMDQMREENRELKKELKELNRRYLAEVEAINETLGKLTHSPLARGKMQEKQIAARLKTVAPKDKFSMRKSTSAGEDIECTVKEDDREIAKIVIESKNVKKWQDDFVEQIKGYMRSGDSPYGIIATTVLPDDSSNDKMYVVTGDGIWIVRLDYLEIAYRAMRDLVVRVSQIEQSSSLQISDYTCAMQRFRDIVTSPEYQRKFGELIGLNREIRDLADKARRYVTNHSDKLNEIATSLMDVANSIEEMNSKAVAEIVGRNSEVSESKAEEATA
jgi:hypothetical protein